MATSEGIVDRRGATHSLRIAHSLAALARKAPPIGAPPVLAALRWLMPLAFRHHDLLTLLQTFTPAISGGGDSDRVRRWVAKADRLLQRRRLTRTTCLYRSLARYALLRAVGEEVRFVLGVRLEGEDLIAHAWLTNQGQPFDEPTKDLSRYAVIMTYPLTDSTPRRRVGSSEEAMIKADPDVLLTELKDGTGVLLQLKTKFYYTLNSTGVFVWKMIQEGRADDEGQIASEIVKAFSGAELDAAARDTSALLGELAEEGLIQPR